MLNLVFISWQWCSKLISIRSPSERVVLPKISEHWNGSTFISTPLHWKSRYRTLFYSSAKYSTRRIIETSWFSRRNFQFGMWNVQQFNYHRKLTPNLAAKRCEIDWTQGINLQFLRHWNEVVSWCSPNGALDNTFTTKNRSFMCVAGKCE